MKTYDNALNAHVVQKNMYDEIFPITKKATRDNKSKPRPTLVDPDFLQGLIDVLEMGARKYGAKNWQKGLVIEEIMDSLERHALAWRRGERDDEESGLHHALHIAANCMFLHYFDKGDK